jgi:hypothetical protein
VDQEAEDSSVIWLGLLIAALAIFSLPWTFPDDWKHDDHEETAPGGAPTDSGVMPPHPDAAPWKNKS